MDLNLLQEKSVNSDSMHTLVLAGAGTGKTRVIIRRIEAIVKAGCAPSKIITTTFTNKAAKELRVRLAESIGEDANSILCGTFHRISTILLRKYGSEIGINPTFQILSEDDARKIIRRILKQLEMEGEASKIVDLISKIKEENTKNFIIDRNGKVCDAPVKNSENNGTLKNFVKNSAKNSAKNSDKQAPFAKVIELYDSELLQNNYFDYADLIQQCIFLFQNCKEITESLAEHILVDEYQDINASQYEWIKLVSDKKHLFCVGDEDQAIYSFRGSNIEYIQKFSKDFPNANIIQLEDNYRSAPSILKGATNLICKNTRTFEKKLVAAKNSYNSNNAISITKTYNEFDESKLVAKLAAKWKQINANYKIAVLVRTNMQMFLIEQAFVEAQIPYKLSDTKFYKKKEILDLISYLKILIYPHDFIAFTRIINSPKRHIGTTRLDMLIRAMKSLDTNFENALTSLLPQLGKNARESCSILLFQVQNWRALLNTIKVDKLLAKIIDDIAYTKQADFTKNQETSLNMLQELLKKEESLQTFLENVQFAEEEQSDAEQVEIMTMHASKGLEFDIVIAPGWEENVFPSIMIKDKADIEEERRLAYVTITRAKEACEIIYAVSRRINGKYMNQMPSRFLFDLDR